MSTPDERRVAVAARLRAALADPSSSARMETALAAGTRPHPDYAPILLARCAVEPDFSVRDTLTWALARHPPEVTVPLLLAEVRTGTGRARSQALHTLSKVGDPAGWPAITDDLLQDPDDEVARSAWRAAVVLVPAGARVELAAVLATQLGRGGRDVRRSLSRAFADLGRAADGVLAAAAASTGDEVRAHALATRRLVADPDETYEAAVFETQRTLALLAAASDPEPPAAAPEQPADEPQHPAAD